ncbi:amino acid adenylation domain-containing protein [Streptomyces sp. NBC_00249]|uniref:non-ribosomal peptide synthetase n=1 Tax=Streptomyces sp. NBC_00249 TaxID=2975690 RepID=UPI00225BF424|nr:non-ribosomal peptide synthetase [Streptomyces sp. NBC_00249]MCX5193513.1 amino acid adenylation domain-containing protein [Streptomyces sp. NBC_00249]
MQSLETLGRLKVAAAQRPREGAFWRAALAALPERTGFPSDAPGRPAEPGPHATVGLDLDADLSARIEKLTRGQEAALHSVLVAAVGTLLQRYTGGEEAVVAIPAADAGGDARPLADALVLRLPFTPELTFRGLLGEVKPRLLAALEHQDYPIELLAEEFGADAGHGAHPFAEVLVDTVRAEQDGPADRPRFPLVFSFARTAGRLSLELRHRPERHSAVTARRLLAHCAALLAGATAVPDDALAALDLHSEADRALIARVNATDAAFEDTVRLDELFSRRVKLTPDATAVAGDGFRLTYADLDARANQLAHTLRSRGVGRDDLVAVLADRSPQMLVAIYAVLKAGGAYLPVDPGYPVERIGYVLDDSAARLVLTLPRYRDLVGEGREALDLTDESAYAEDASTPEVIGDARDLAYVIYTSGSTGNPKGVQIEHRSVVNRIGWMQRAYPIDPADVIMQKTPTSFDVSVWELFWWMFEGAAVCLPEPGAERDPEALTAAIERHGVTTMHFVPSMLAAFLDFVSGAGEQAKLASLRQVFASGEALTPHHVRRFGEVTAATGGPAARLINLYGPTEATVDVTHHACGPEDVDRVPIGLPIDNTRILMLDAQLRPQPVGVPGELCIAGVGLARGYLGRPELTAERFVAAPLAGEERVYRTGDLTRWLADGTIEYLGRIDHQVKVRGYRIELGEIEEQLRRHPEVKDAVVVARKADDGQTYLVGYVQSATAVAEDELKRHLGVTLPEYMVPPRIVALEVFPLSPNGKLDRRALPEPGQPEREAAAYVAPTTPEEIELARIWGEVLGYEQIGVEDNFFALGGNSIHFVTVLAKARAAGLDFTFQQFFQNPTVAELARSLAESGPTAERTPLRPFELLTPQDRELIPAGIEDAYPMTQLQAGLVFQSELSQGTAEYHDILSYMIQSPFDAECFEQAARVLVQRNPIFRTSYHLTGYSEYLQLVHEDAPLPLYIADLRGMSEAEQEEWYRDWAAQEKAYRFVWNEPGLVRLHVHVLSDDLYRYSLSQHNSALDGWSITLVHTTLFDLFYRLREGRALPDAPVENHARNYVALERQSLADEDHRTFWAQLLEDSTFTELPRTRQAGEADLFPVVFHEAEFPRGLSDRIVALANQLSVPVKNVLMAAHAKVLSLVSGDRDVMTGYEHSGRPEAEDATRAIGLFLNTVPFRVRTAEGSWEDLIRQVYRSETELLPARRYPMAQMKNDLGTQDALFETAFNFTHFYLLKQLEALDGFSLLDVRANSETEFVLRAEFSRHFVTDEVRLSLHYHAHLFEPWQIARMGAYYTAAFEQMTADLTAPHHLADLLAADELADLERAERSEVLPDALAAPLAEPGAAFRARVLDEHGLAVPFGTIGRIVLTADSHEPVPTGLYGRRNRDGLELLGDQPVRHTFGLLEAEAAEADPVREQAADRRPVDEVDRRIAQVWSAILDVPLDEIGLDDNFFALGGASLAAMRVVMELEGLISLTDLMRNSTLAPLGAVARANLAEVEQAEPRSQNLLQSLSAAPAEAECVLVCFPYAGGNAINFEPLAQAIDAVGGAVAVYGAELPGHDAGRPHEEFCSLEDTARRAVEEIRQTVAGRPVMLWGHCVGSALAVETARLLEAEGSAPVHVFVGGKLLHSAEITRQGLEQAAAMTDDDIVRWLVDETGFAEFDSLRPEHAKFVAGVFRHDAGSANGYLLAAEEQGPKARLSAPLTAVFAGDDPLTPDHGQRFDAWSLFSDQPQLVELGGGGHYFCRTAAPEVADVVLGRWNAASENR